MRTFACNNIVYIYNLKHWGYEKIYTTALYLFDSFDVNVRL